MKHGCGVETAMVGERHFSDSALQDSCKSQHLCLVAVSTATATAAVEDKKRQWSIVEQRKPTSVCGSYIRVRAGTLTFKRPGRR